MLYVVPRLRLAGSSASLLHVAMDALPAQVRTGSVAPVADCVG